MSGRYVAVRYPWRAVIDRRSPYPARFYAALIDQAMRYRMPARKRFGRAAAAVGRQGVPSRRLVAASLGALPRHQHPDIDRLLEDVAGAWPELARRSRRPLPSPSSLSALAVRRSAALTVFVFGHEPDPLLVLKLPSPGDDRVDREAAALLEAEPAGVSPRSLGRVGDARVQEALDGAPLRLEPVAPEGASRLRWGSCLAALATSARPVARVTAKPVASCELGAPLATAVEYPGLDGRTMRTLRAAARDLKGLSVSVLRHGDASAQNCLFRGQRLTGLVDWEAASSTGAPGFDVLNSAMAYIDHGVGLVRWSDELVLESFETAWRESTFFRGARAAADDAARAGGVPERYLEPLAVGFFANRLGRRAVAPEAHLIGPHVAAATLEIVCRD
jgi:hypothetical protein